MIDEGLGEVGTQLHDPDAGLGLRVRNVEASAIRIVQAHVADAEFAQLAVSYAAVAEDPNHERPTHVSSPASKALDRRSRAVSRGLDWRWSEPR
jgi:hypothetical protein